MGGRPVSKTHNRVAAGLPTSDAARAALDARSDWLWKHGRPGWGRTFRCVRHEACLATGVVRADYDGTFSAWESKAAHAANLASRRGRKGLLSSAMQRRCDKSIKRFAPTPEQVCLEYAICMQEYVYMLLSVS